jgi:hypothetical protein
MPTVSDFLNNVRKIDVKSLIKAVVSENEIRIIDLNREDQIFKKGIDSNGRSLFHYELATQGMFDANEPLDTKGQNKSVSDRYNLFWSGDSYYSFYAYVKGDKLYITTSSRGRRLLQLHGGSEIFGLTNENSEIANWSIIAPALNVKIKNELL